MPLVSMPDGAIVDMPDDPTPDQLSRLAKLSGRNPSLGSVAIQPFAGFNESLGDLLDVPGRAGDLGVELGRRALGRESIWPPERTASEYSPTSIAAEYLRSERMSPPARNAPERVARAGGKMLADTLPYAAVPPLAALRGATMPATTAGGIAQAIIDRAAAKPIANLAGETVSAVSAGVGGGIGKEVLPEHSGLGEAGGMLAGGAAPAVVPVVAKYAPVAQLLKALARQMGFTDSTGRASARVQSLVRDPRAAADAMEAKGNIANLSPAQRADEPGLYGLEQAVRNESLPAAADLGARDQRTASLLQGEMEALGGGDVAATQKMMAERRAGVEQALRDRAARQGEAATSEAAATTADVGQRKDALLAAIEARKAQTAATAEGAASPLRPTQRESEASRTVREEIDAGLQAARQRQTELWNAIPNEAKVGTESGLNAYGDVVGKLPKAQAEDVPAIARKMFEPGTTKEPNASFIGTKNTVNEVWGLRSKLLEASREAKAAGKGNTARIADNLADALLEDLGAAGAQATGPAGEPLRKALDFTREMKQRFRQGNVGKILERERTGEGSVAPELTLEATIGAGRTKGAIAAGEIGAASKDAGASREGMRQYVLNRFVQRVGREGPINPDAARKFVAENADLVDMFPGLKDDLLGATTARELSAGTAARMDQRAKNVNRIAESMTGRAEKGATETVKRAEGVADQRIANINDQRKSFTAKFLDADPDKAMNVVLSHGGESKEFMAELVRQAAKDPTGKAIKGLRTSAIDRLLGERTAAVTDTAGRKAMSGRGVNEMLQDKRTKDVLTQLFNPEEMGRIEKIAGEMARVESSAAAKPRGGIIEPGGTPGLLRVIARIAGAREGSSISRSIGGGGIQIPQIMSGRFASFVDRATKDRAREVLIRAVDDPDLMRSLLLPVSKPESLKRMNAWLFAAPGEIADEK